VRGVDNIGAFGPWVVFDPATVHFTTDLVPPTTPGGPYNPLAVLLVFENAPEGDVPFTWAAAFDPSGPPLPVQYHLEVSSSDTFSPLIFDTFVSTAGTTAKLPASENLYFWRVSAVDAAGNPSVPSPANYFQVAWTVPPDNSDRFANCGVSVAGGPALMAAVAGLTVLLGFAARRRRRA
jgi:MYXO-CTERM domain-containing protein